MMKRWSGRFMCPNGIRRTFNPKKWERGTQVLVFGEMVAFGAAIAAIPGWTHGKWFLYAAPIIAAGFLAWYALDKSSLGEMPLTGVSANRIANVVHLVNTEEKLGRVVSWPTITADGTKAEMDLSQMRPEIKIHIARRLPEERLGEDLFRPLDARGVQISESDADMVLGALSVDHVHITVPDRPGAQDFSSPSHP